MNAVSTREAIGSAVKASAAGNAIDAISKPSLSKLRTNLHIRERESKNKIRPSMYINSHTIFFGRFNCN